MAQVLEMFAQQAEVQRFFGRHTQPVAVVVLGHAGKAPHRVQRQVDGVELDVADRVQQRGAALRRVDRTLGQLLHRHQVGPGRATRQRAVGGQHQVWIDLHLAGQQRGVQTLGGSHFRRRIVEAQGGQGQVANLHP